MKWLKKAWYWIVGAPVVLGIFALFRRWLHPEPPPRVPKVTKDQADAEHKRIDEEAKEDIKATHDTIDEELKNALKKFGG